MSHHPFTSIVLETTIPASTEYTTLPHIVIIPTGTVQFVSPPKRHASDTAISKLVGVKVDSLPEEERRCFICMEWFATPLVVDSDGEPAEVDISQNRETPLQLPCGHIFGGDCLTRWLKESPACPLCRVEVASVEEVPAQVHLGIFWFFATSREPLEQHHPNTHQDLECAQRALGLCSEESFAQVSLECGHRFHPVCLGEACASAARPVDLETDESSYCPRCRRSRRIQH